mmetsp:Transcript_6147/g.13891  ORF Transcript_6147/g.13891 Transcript_6147/m.13891 type:complete len:119 (-) Transcript_6147:260-616(-)
MTLAEAPWVVKSAEAQWVQGRLVLLSAAGLLECLGKHHFDSNFHSDLLINHSTPIDCNMHYSGMAFQVHRTQCLTGNYLGVGLQEGGLQEVMKEDWLAWWRGWESSALEWDLGFPPWG